MQEQLVFDMGAGLAELVEGDQNLSERLNDSQITFVVPGFFSQKKQPMQSGKNCRSSSELKTLLATFRVNYSRSTEVTLHFIPTAKSILRRGEPRFVQMMSNT